MTGGETLPWGDPGADPLADIRLAYRQNKERGIGAYAEPVFPKWLKDRALTEGVPGAERLLTYETWDEGKGARRGSGTSLGIASFVYISIVKVELVKGNTDG